MFSFLAKHPPRTRSAHLSKLVFDDGLSTAEFKSPGDRFLVINRLPPTLSDSALSAAHQRTPTQALPHKGAHSSLAPPLHRHWSQDETFHVIRGTAEFTTLSRGGEGGGSKEKVGLATAGAVVVIPRREVHTFCNASAEEELVIEFVLDPIGGRGRDEAYFRNVWGYRNDCKKAGMQRSLFQALSFMYSGGVVMALPGPEPLSKWLGYALNYVGGLLIGRLLLGYQGSYPEYFRERTS